MTSLLKTCSKWIMPFDEVTEYIVKQNFNVEDVLKAEIVFGILGVFEAYLNGERIGDDYFLPFATDYHKRDGVYEKGEYFHRLYCPCYDVTGKLKNGDNTLAVMVAGGVYGAGIGIGNEEGKYGNPRLSYAIKLTYNSGRIGYVFSSEDALWKESFIKKYDFYCGEVQDFKEFDEGEWKKVLTIEAPDTELMNQDDYPTDKVIRTVEPVLISEKDGKRVYDCGEIITGIARFKCLEEGASIRVLYDERLDGDGRPLALNKEWFGYSQYSEFLNCKKGQVLSTKLTWHCFRYFETEGNAEVIDAQVIHCKIDVNSEFECSNETLNWLYKAFLNTQFCNMHMGIPTDCPHIERKGYTGDGHLTCGAVMRTTASESFYRKWLNDISDSQDRLTGRVPYTAPYYDTGGGPGGWGVAVAVVPFEYYLHFGDKEVLREFYPKIIHWFSFLENSSKDGLIVKGEKDSWFLGDWCFPSESFLGDEDSIVIPPPFVNTYYYIKAMEIAYKIENILGIDHKVNNLDERIAEKKETLTRHYFDDNTGNFAQNQQGANAFAVDLGLGDERTFNNFVNHYKITDEYDTGIFGTDVLTRILFEKGEDELAVALLCSEKEISYHTWMEAGYSTLWESWKGYRSHCHPMFGSVVKYLFDYILGIRIESEETGYKKILINPTPGTLKWAKGKMMTGYGEIKVSYDEEGIKVYIPEGVSADLLHNGKRIKLNSGDNCYKFAV